MTPFAESIHTLREHLGSPIQRVSHLAKTANLLCVCNTADAHTFLSEKS